MFQIQIKGLHGLIQKNRLMIQMLERGDPVEELVKRIVRSAKHYAPRKSGELVKSITYDRIGPNKFVIKATARNKNDEPYPIYLEFGTKYIYVGTPSSPRTYTSTSGKTAQLPFIRSAIWRSTKQKDIDAVVSKMMEIYN